VWVRQGMQTYGLSVRPASAERRPQKEGSHGPLVRLVDRGARHWMVGWCCASYQAACDVQLALGGGPVQRGGAVVVGLVGGGTQGHQGVRSLRRGRRGGKGESKEL